MSAPSVKLGPYTVSQQHEPIIIAEAGINHNGDLGKAKDLLAAAADAGAHIIKYQTHLPDHEMLKEGFSAGYIGESFYDLLARCVIDTEGHRELMKLAEEKGIMFMSTPFSIQAADLLDDLGVEAFKTGSGELTNLPMQRHIARKGKPTIISTGMSTLDEVGRTVEAVLPINPKVILMNCTSTYPAAHKDIRLLGIRQLRERFGLLVGQSDHSIGIATCLGAVALGATVIEKHFTLDRRWPGPDQGASIEPDELKRLVVESKQIWEALSERGAVIEGERPVQDMARESIVTIAAVRAGERLSLNNLWVKRPGTGIPAARLEEFLGKTARRDLASNHLLKEDDAA